MKCTKKITITGYTVKYADLREPKPRTIREEVYILDKDGVEALSIMGLNVADFITTRYERGGYHVISVERIRARRTVAVDLHQLWEQAAAAEVSAKEDIPE